MPFIDVKKEKIFYSISSSNACKQKMSLLLVHGSGGDNLHWPERLRNFPKANVYAIDLPGHGRSSGYSRKSVDEYADFIEAFVSRMNLKDVILFGHSLGGAIVQRLALRFPSWLSRIVLVGTGVRLRVSPAILEGLISDFKGTIDLICKWAFGSTASESLIKTVGEGFAKTDPDVILGDYSACNEFDIAGRAGEISIPTLVVSGTEDKLTPIKYGKYLYNHIPGAKLAIIEEGGHMMAIEKPDEFMKSIINFLY